MTGANIIEIFCILDEFCKYFAPKLKKHTLDTSGKRRRNLPCLMSDSEVMTILVLLPCATATSSRSISVTSVTTCARSFHTACHTTGSSNARSRWDCIFCCSSRHAHWGNVREYPLSAPLH